MLQLVQNIVEDSSCLPHMEHLFHIDVNFRHLFHTFLHLIRLHQQPVKCHPLFDISICRPQPMVKRQPNQILAVHQQRIKHQKHRFALTLAPWFVLDQLPIENIPKNAAVFILIFSMVDICHVER